jgi:hypothetical protein
MKGYRNGRQWTIKEAPATGSEEHVRDEKSGGGVSFGWRARFTALHARMFVPKSRVRTMMNWRRRVQHGGAAIARLASRHAASHIGQLRLRAAMLLPVRFRVSLARISI